MTPGPFPFPFAPSSGTGAGGSISAGTSSDPAKLFGASDLVSALSAAGPVLDLERRHWRARSVPSMTFPCWSSISLRRSLRYDTTV